MRLHVVGLEDPLDSSEGTESELQTHNGQEQPHNGQEQAH